MEVSWGGGVKTEAAQTPRPPHRQTAAKRQERRLAFKESVQGTQVEDGGEDCSRRPATTEASESESVGECCSESGLSCSVQCNMGKTGRIERAKRSGLAEKGFETRGRKEERTHADTEK